MCFGEPDIMSPRWDELQKPRSPTPINKAIHKIHGQLTHMHAVGSSFHSKASAWKTKLLYLCAWHAPAKHLLENTQWGAFSLTPSFFLSLAKTLPSSLWWQCSVDNGIDDWWTILALITASTIDKLSISTALSIMHVQQGYKTTYIDHIVYTI